MQFLDVSYQAKLESIHRKSQKDGSIVYSFPFFFIVPFETEGLDASKPLLCRKLPPTFSTRALYSDLISITYQLCAVVQYCKEQDARLEMSQSVKKIEKSQIINFLLYTDIEPPTHVASFPDEFILRVSSPIWKYLSDCLGEITMSTREPLPLVYSAYEDRPSTDLTLSIAARTLITTQRLRAVSLNVIPAIRVKTFYAVEPMPCLPRQTTLYQNQTIRLYDEVIKLEHAKYTQLDWRYCPTIETGEPPRYEDAVADNVLERTSTNPNLSGNSGGEWRASACIPIQPQEMILPTFCRSLISRSYSLILRIRVAGIRIRKSDFEVPLQVVHLRPSQVRNDSIHDERSSSCIGPEGLLAQPEVRYSSQCFGIPINVFRISLPAKGDRGGEAILSAKCKHQVN
jgi:Fe-S-cluster containining protein